MKKPVFVLFCLTILFFNNYHTEAQVVPCAGMETWITTGNYSNPQYWDSPNQESTAIPIFGAPVLTKSGSPHSGSWCAKLESKSLIVATIPGIMTLGNLNIDIVNMSFNLTGGAAVNTRPTSVKGYYKYAPAGSGDTAAVVVFFTKYNTASSNTDTIGIGFFMDGTAVSSWTEFDCPIFFFTPETPDTMNIVITCTSSMSGPAGSVLYVDDLVLDYSTGITDPLMAEQPNVYYNPSSTSIDIHLESVGTDEFHVNIYNLNGQRIRSAQFGATSLLTKSIGVSGVKAGMYIVEVRSGSVVTTNKVVIQ